MQADLLAIDTVLSQPAIAPAPQPRALYALVRMRAGAGAGEARLPLDVRFVLDRSGSMSSTAVKGRKATKMDLLRDAVCDAVARLEAEDRVGVVSFDDKNRTNVAPTVLSSAAARQRVHDAIQAIRTGGGTHLSGSLKHALGWRSHGATALERIVIFTDGEVNSPSEASEDRACRKLAEQARAEGVPLVVLGAGASYNEKLLEALAGLSGGRMAHVSQVDEVRRVLAEELRCLADVAVTGLEVSVSCGSAARLVSVSRVVPQLQPFNASHPSFFASFLGDVDRARGQALLLQWEVLADVAGPLDVATVECMYDVPSLGLKGLRSRATVQVRVDVGAASACDAEVLATVRLDGASRLQTQALASAEAGDLATALAGLERAATLYGQAGLSDLAVQTRTLTNQLRTAGAGGTDAILTRRTLTTMARGAATRRMEATGGGGPGAVPPVVGGGGAGPSLPAPGGAGVDGLRPPTGEEA